MIITKRSRWDWRDNGFVRRIRSSHALCTREVRQYHGRPLSCEPTTCCTMRSARVCSRARARGHETSGAIGNRLRRSGYEIYRKRDCWRNTPDAEIDRQWIVVPAAVRKIPKRSEIRTRKRRSPSAAYSWGQTRETYHPRRPYPDR